MNIEIEIDVFFNTDDTFTKQESGIKFSLDECALRKVTIYNIDNIAPYFDSGSEYCKVYSGFSEYIVPFTYEEVKQILRRSRGLVSVLSATN